MNAAEEHRLLEAPLCHPPRQDLHVEHSVTEYPLEVSDDSSSAAALEHPAGSGLPSLPRSLTYLNGLALVVGLQIGSGIFSAPSAVGTHVPSHAIAISVWFLAGVLVWTGASSFIELGTRVPQNGGIQEYLRYCYGDIYGFLFAWVWLLVSRPCAMAMVALVFSEYLFKAVSPDQDVSTWILKAAALLAIVLITYLNCMGTHIGTGAANFFLVLKVFGLGSIAVIGLACAFIGTTHQDGNHKSNVTEHGSSPPPLSATSDPGHSWIWMSLGNFTDAVLAALFAYGGWESVSENGRFISSPD
jgi:amino acid transporter